MGNATNTRSLSRSAVGIFDDATIHGLETVQVFCPECGKLHSFEDQGLRWVGLGCGTVHFPSLDEVALAERS